MSKSKTPLFSKAKRAAKVQGVGLANDRLISTMISEAFESSRYCGVPYVSSEVIFRITKP